ncbi:MAG: helicase RepA family protein [Mogibacterium sp.]|nr:helicase RepA family protein [Mogibacterium sp.]
MAELKVYNAEKLFYEPIESTPQVVTGLIPSGLTVIAGTQKCGKSWMILDLCLSVSKGEPFLGIPTEPIDVLYMALEDTPERIQKRMYKLTDDVSPRLRFATSSKTLSNGLIGELNEYMHQFPETKMIVIDTFMMVRLGGGEGTYANDYADASKLKKFADAYKIAIILVHHVRKMRATDIFEMISGTNGITGAADTNMVLDRPNPHSKDADLHMKGRDIEVQVWKIQFENCKWSIVERKNEEQLFQESIPTDIHAVIDFMSDKREWKGTATELVGALDAEGVPPNLLSKHLSQYDKRALKPAGIYFKSKRTNGKRSITLRKSDDECR